jgi:hypothetical protein
MERCAVPRVRPVAEAYKPANRQLIQYYARVPEFGGTIIDKRTRAEADKPANRQLIQYYARVPEYGGKIGTRTKAEAGKHVNR